MSLTTTEQAEPPSRARLIPDPEEQPTIGLDVAAPAVGIGMTTAYELARTTKELIPGVPIIKVKGQYRIVTKTLRRALALDD